MFFLLRKVGWPLRHEAAQTDQPSFAENTDLQWDRPRFRAPELRPQAIPVEELKFRTNFRAKDISREE